MYVDYIRAYEWNGQGSVHLGPPTAQNRSFGIFTDNTPTNGKLTPGLDSEIFVWEGTLADSTIPPREGDNAMSWQTTGKGWFGAGVMSHQPLNMFDFEEGHLNFDIQIPANVSFEIGIIDAWGNQQYVNFPAFQTTYGLVRNGQWGQASIPVSDIRGTAIDLRMLNYSFVILERNGTSANFAVDNIYWDAPSVALPGDFDGDGDVDGRDFLAWQRGESPDPLSAGDLEDWQTNYGMTAPVVAEAVTAVPEPSGLLLLVSWLATGAWGRRSSRRASSNHAKI
jgi:hypothetical protein